MKNKVPLIAGAYMCTKILQSSENDTVTLIDMPDRAGRYNTEYSISPWQMLPNIRFLNVQENPSLAVSVEVYSPQQQGEPEAPHETYAGDTFPGCADKNARLFTESLFDKVTPAHPKLVVVVPIVENSFPLRMGKLRMIIEEKDLAVCKNNKNASPLKTTIDSTLVEFFGAQYSTSTHQQTCVM